MDMRENFIKGIAMFLCPSKMLWAKTGAYQKATRIFSDLAARGHVYYEGLRLREEIYLTKWAAL